MKARISKIISVTTLLVIVTMSSGASAHHASQWIHDACGCSWDHPCSCPK